MTWLTPPPPASHEPRRPTVNRPSATFSRPLCRLLKRLVRLSDIRCFFSPLLTLLTHLNPGSSQYTLAHPSTPCPIQVHLHHHPSTLNLPLYLHPSTSPFNPPPLSSHTPSQPPPPHSPGPSSTIYPDAAVDARCLQRIFSPCTNLDL